MKKLITIGFLFFLQFINSQVGINTTVPNAQLDIRSSNQATPINTDGILIPKVDAFPATNPTAAQQGMLLYLTTTVGTDLPGFYYWDNATTDWIPIGNNNNNNWNLSGNTVSGTEFIGTTNNFPLKFRVNNVSTGLLDNQNDNYAFGENALSQTSPGIQSIAIGTSAGLNQQSTAFGNVFIGHQSGENNTTGLRNTFIGLRAGRANTTTSNNTMIGFNSGVSSISSGNSFFGFGSGFANTTGGLNTFIGSNSGGSNTTATLNTFVGALSGFDNTTGNSNTFLGHQSGVSTTTGGNNTFVGQQTGNANTTGFNNTAIGRNANFGANNLTNATAIGALAQVDLSNSLVLGSVNGVNGATSSVKVGIGITTPQNLLHLHTSTEGQTFLQFTNASTGVTSSDGLVIGNNVGTQEAGIVNFEDANMYLESGINGAQITVGKNGNIGIGAFDFTNLPLDKLHVEGNIRMVDGNQAIGRVLTSDANGRATWQNTTASAWGLLGNAGTNATTNFLGTTDNVDLVFRRNNILSGRIGLTNTFFGNSSGLVNTGDYNTFIGERAGFANATGDNNTFIGRLAGANGTFGSGNSYLGYGAGLNNTGNSNLILGAFASQNTTGSFNVFVGNQSGGNNTTGARNTLLGFNSDLGAANLTNATAIGNLAQVDTSNSMVLGSINGVNGSLVSTNVGIGTTTPLHKLDIKDNSTSTTVGQLYLEQEGTGDAIMHIGNTGARHFNLGLDTSADSFKIGTSATTATAVTTGTLMTIQATGEVGIGTATPTEKLHVSGPAGLTTVRVANTSTTGATSNVALDFFRNTGINTDWRIYNIGPNLTIGSSSDDLATVNDLYQFLGARFMPMNDGTQSLGQAANRWNTVFATNGTISTSDRREKKEIQPLTYGLQQLMQLKPVTFRWNNNQIDNNSKHLGFIAQDLQEVIPEVVVDSQWVGGEEGTSKTWQKAPLLGVNYAEVLPVLVKSIQEQQSIIEKQQKEIEQQKVLLESVLQRLEQLEKK